MADGPRQDALRSFEQAIAQKADYAEAHYMRATVLKQEGKADEAIAGFREAIRHQPGSAEAHLSLGQALQQKRDPGAAAELAEAERLNKKKADAQAAAFALSAGRSKMSKGDLAGAIVGFREAVRLAPDNADAHYQLALALRKKGARAEARRHFEEAQRLAPYLTAPGTAG